MQPAIEKLIYVIRDKQVMIDSDLAMLYQVETGALNRAVKRNIKRFLEYLEDFLRNLLLGETNELHNRNLHISGLLNTKKVDIEAEKVDIQTEKLDIDRVLLQKKMNFSAKTIIHIQRMFERFGFDEIFGRSSVVELLELQNSSASNLLSKMAQAGIIEPVSGHGKGKYKFVKELIENGE